MDRDSVKLIMPLAFHPDARAQRGFVCTNVCTGLPRADGGWNMAVSRERWVILGKGYRRAMATAQRLGYRALSGGMFWVAPGLSHPPRPGLLFTYCPVLSRPWSSLSVMTSLLGSKASGSSSGFALSQLSASSPASFHDPTSLPFPW